MAAPFGLIQGLSQDLGYGQRINDLRYNEQQDKIAGAEAEARAKLFAEDMNYKGPMNSYDAPLAKDYAYKKMKEIGQFAKDNPNYRYDPMLQVELKNLKTEIKDNPIIRRGMATDEAYKQYLLDRQEAIKNPNSWDMEMLDKEGKKFENYFQHGHSDGAEAKLHEGEKPVVYTRPAPLINVAETAPKIGADIHDYIPVQGKTPGENWAEPKPEQISALTDTYIREHQRSVDKWAQEQGIKDPVQKREAVKNMILSGFDRRYHGGDANAEFDREMRRQHLELEKKKQQPPKPAYTPWEYVIDPKNRAGELTEAQSAVITGDRPAIIIQGKYTGGKNGRRIDLTGLPFNSKLKYVKRASGIPEVLGYVKVPAKIAYEKGLIDQYDEDDENVEDIHKTTGRISADMIGQAAWDSEVDKDGKKRNFINVSYNKPFNINDQKLRQSFNSLVDVSKNNDAASDPYAQQQEAAPQVYTGSKEAFKKAGWSDEQIQQGVQQGKIKIQ